MDNVLEMSNMYPEHRFVMSNLEKILDRYTSKLKCVALREAKYEWTEYPGEKFEPDVSLLCGIRHRKKLCYTDVPRFVAEVLSDSTEQADRNIKMEVYARVGVQEYWLIDWRTPGGTVERYLLDDAGERYLLHDIKNGNEDADVTLNIISFPMWTFRLSELMKHIGEDEITE
ncbi:MAG TPA: hypothetical protein DCL38_01245 [Lachnospiraceae bacterium]|nr:hypothetical protein [Lachnospiraceae bacterium]